MQTGSWGSRGLIYLKKLWISYANEFLGIPRITYLEKVLSVCGRREAHLLKERPWTLMQMSSWDPQELIYFKKL